MQIIQIWLVFKHQIMCNNFFKQNLGAEEILKKILSEVERIKRPAEEVILDDYDLQQCLKISKRKTAELRLSRKITYSKPDGKALYILSDVLIYAKKNQVKAIDEDLNIR